MARLTDEQTGIEKTHRVRAREAYGEWFRTLGPFSHFVTRTFRDDVTEGFTKVGIATARKAVGDLMEISDAEAGVCVIEWQKERRVPHLHSLIRTVGSVDGEWMQVRDDRAFGFSRWLVVREDGKAPEYIGKYLVTDLYQGPEVEMYVWNAQPSLRQGTLREFMEEARV